MIESKQNKQVKQWKKLHRKKYRDELNTFLVEGWHLVEEAIKSDWTIEKLIVHEDETVPNEWENHEFIYVSDEVFNELSQTETPQGIMALVQIKVEEKNDFQKVLLIDAVQDPGNVGTMIRTALAFDIDAVTLGKGSADLFHDKVIRATQGALFHIPVIRGNLDEWIDKCRTNDIKVFGTALDEQAKPLNEIQSPGTFAVIVGNEGSGVNPEFLSRADETVYIPIHRQSESLNVGIATSIVLYHFSLVT
ncbi:TrmH family RNA methyltransferase [Filobacillus milosensis]|nr:RNA methyltransferase [Filobacillus milosensis]